MQVTVNRGVSGVERVSQSAGRGPVQVSSGVDHPLARAGGPPGVARGVDEHHQSPLQKPDSVARISVARLIV